MLTAHKHGVDGRVSAISFPANKISSTWKTNSIVQLRLCWVISRQYLRKGVSDWILRITGRDVSWISPEQYPKTTHLMIIITLHSYLKEIEGA